MPSEPRRNAATTSHADSCEATLERVLTAMRDLRDGNFHRRLPVTGDAVTAEVAEVFNDLAEHNENMIVGLGDLRESLRSGHGREPRMEVSAPPESGWARAAEAVNGLLDDLLRPAEELSRVLSAVAEGDLSQRIPSQMRRRMPGELTELADAVNAVLDKMSLFSTEVIRLAGEIGTEGRLGGQAQVPGLSGSWRELIDALNSMASNLTKQVRDISQVATAVAGGDLSRKITVEVSGEMLELKTTINAMVDQLSGFAGEVTRLAHEVASYGRLGGQADVPDAAGTWRDVVDSVNFMAHNLTMQVRNIAQVATAVATGDLSQKIEVDARGEILEL